MCQNSLYTNLAMFNSLAKSSYFSTLVFIFKGLILGYKRFSLSLWDCNTLYQDSYKWYLIFASSPQAYIAKSYKYAILLILRVCKCKEDLSWGKVMARGWRKGKYFSGIAGARPARARAKPSGDARQRVCGGDPVSGGIQVTKSYRQKRSVTGFGYGNAAVACIERPDSATEQPGQPDFNFADLTSATQFPAYVTGTLEGLGPVVDVLVLEIHLPS